MEGCCEYAVCVLVVHAGDGAGVAEAVPDHVAHRRGLGLDDYVGGPFEDRTGGLIIFRANGEQPSRAGRGNRPLCDARTCAAVLAQAVETGVDLSDGPNNRVIGEQSKFGQKATSHRNPDVSVRHSGWKDAGSRTPGSHMLF
jgi:hypothetical protein